MERNEFNDVAPTSLAHLIGQRSVVEQVRVALRENCEHEAKTILPQDWRSEDGFWR